MFFIKFDFGLEILFSAAQTCICKLIPNRVHSKTIIESTHHQKNSCKHQTCLNIKVCFQIKNTLYHQEHTKIMSYTALGTF